MTTTSSGRGIFDRLVVRLVAVTVLAGLVAAAAGALAVATVTRNALRSEIVERNLAVAEELALRFDTRVDSLADTMRIHTTHPAIASATAAATEDLRAVLAASATYDELILYTAEGEPVAAAAARFLARAEDYPRRQGLLELVSQNGVWVEVVQRFPPMVEMAIPVENPPGNPVGVLAARVPLELIAGFLQQLTREAGVGRFLVDSEGRVLVHPQRDRMAQAQQFPLEEVWAQDGRGRVEIDGEGWLVAAVPLTSLDAVLVVQQDEEIALAPVRAEVTDLGLLVAGVIGATVLAVSLAGRRLLQPLRPLSAGVEALARGERGVRVPTVTAGELAGLTGRFNRMAETLDRRQEELSQLHHLALLVTSRAERRQVVEDLAHGARRLLGSGGAAVVGRQPDGELQLEAASGSLPEEQSVLEAAAACWERGTVQHESATGGTLVVAVPVRGVEGRTEGALVVATTAVDEDDLQLAETFASFAAVAMQNVRRLELEQALTNELQQAVDQRRQLMGHVTHDLRVPVTCIESFSGELRERWSSLADDEREDLITQIEEQAHQLDELVTALLEYSSTERGQRSASIFPLPLREAVEAALEAVTPLVGDRPMEVRVPQVEVLADAVLLTRGLTHLLTNAIRYSPPGTPVTVEAGIDQERVRIDVIDQGSGLDAETAARAFEPFWRRRTDEEEPPGLGLGLALTAEYVRAMGGTVGVDSTPGQGSTFSLTLRRVK